MKKCIPLPKRVHKKTKKVGDLNELLNYFPDVKAFLDATEQEIPRPNKNKRRKSYYSGKKKRHTVKTQLITNKEGVIIDITGHEPGRKHDYEIFKRKHPPLPPDAELNADSGFRGIEKDFPSLKSKIPVKKPRGKKLEKREKRHNRNLNRERVVVEHVIGRMKKFKIMEDKFRNRLTRYDGLINFRVMVQGGFDLGEFVR